MSKQREGQPKGGDPNYINPLRNHDWKNASPADRRHILTSMRRNMAPKDPITRELGPTEPHKVDTGTQEERSS